MGRRVSSPRFGGALVALDAMHTRFRVRVLRTGPVTLDERIMAQRPWTGSAGRPSLIVCLRGAIWVGSKPNSGTWLGPRDFAIGGCLGYAQTRTCADTVLLRIDWTDGFLTPDLPAVVRLGRLPTVAHAVLTSQLEPCSEGPLHFADLHGDVAGVLRVLRQEGVDFCPLEAHDLHEEHDGKFAPLAAALERNLSRLDRSPMSVDLVDHLDISRRTSVRQLKEFCQTYSTNGVGLRELRERWRIAAGVALATHPAASSEHLAHVLGYSGPSALCHAFAREGLPAPSRVPSVVSALR